MNAADILAGRLPERIVNRIQVAETGCWEWTAGRNPKGYGRARHDGRAVLVHRLTFTVARGPIPEGMDLDHLCRVRHCVNPDHLEPVTNAENARRSAAARTHCPQGHPYDEANTYVNPADGNRRCRKCKGRFMREWKRNWRASRKAVA